MYKGRWVEFEWGGKCKRWHGTRKSDCVSSKFFFIPHSFETAMKTFIFALAVTVPSFGGCVDLIDHSNWNICIVRVIFGFQDYVYRFHSVCLAVESVSVWFCMLFSFFHLFPIIHSLTHLYISFSWLLLIILTSHGLSKYENQKNKAHSLLSLLSSTD